ncbi:MAG: hypothetical protein FJ145_17580 [Deltaproteobacteria bacterium]|nr:hypothetical protein [Deltaproteobacteria bacterium]
MPALSNARALRVIGQDLETRGLKTFDIRRQRDRFEVHCGYQAPPAPTPVLLEYSAADIDELESRAQSNRRDATAPLDLLSLSQMLRSLGGYFDGKNINLVRISNVESAGAEARFKIEGETERGERLTDERSASAIYDMGVNMYKQRGRATERYARWRR